MNTKKNQLIAGIGIVLILIIGLVVFLTRDTAEAPVIDTTVATEETDTTSTPEENSPETAPTVSTPAPKPVVTKPVGSPAPDGDVYEVITYSDNGFSPASHTVTKGEIVFFWNKSSSELWVSSNPNACSGDRTRLFDSCGDIAKGNGWTYIFTESGTYTYSDHNRPGLTGTIVVQ